MGTRAARDLHQRLKWVSKLRPMLVGAFVADLLAPDRRAIINTKIGLRFYVDPLANLGEETKNSYRPLSSFSY